MDFIHDRHGQSLVVRFASRFGVSIMREGPQAENVTHNLRTGVIGPSGTLEAGTHSVEWDHRDDQGRAVHPGLYASRLVAGSFRAERKMMLTP